MRAIQGATQLDGTRARRLVLFSILEHVRHFLGVAGVPRHSSLNNEKRSNGLSNKDWTY